MDIVAKKEEDAILEEDAIIELIDSDTDVRELIKETLASFRLHKSILIEEKIIITYDAGEDFDKIVHEGAKEKIIETLYKKGIRHFHSPTRSTIIFKIQSSSYAYWHKEMTSFFESLRKDVSFYYSIALINSGVNYDDKPNYILNNGIKAILNKLAD